MHILGDDGNVFGYCFLALMVVDQEMRSFERGPGEGWVEFGKGGRAQEQN
jgi:hypothetical protein